MRAPTKRLIEEHLDKARSKHPRFVEGLIQVPAIAAEELGEMVKEINDAYYANVTIEREILIKAAKEEAFDLIAVLIRFVEDD